MTKLKSILFRREYAGYLMGAASLLALQELPGYWGVLVGLALVFLVFPQVRKFCV